MTAKQALGLGTIFVFVILVVGVTVYNIPVSFAARQPETLSPTLLPDPIHTIQPSEPLPGQIPEVISNATAMPVQIPLCTFDVAASAPPSNFSLDSITFSDPEIVLTSKTSVRLYQWLPDSQSWLIGRRLVGSPKEHLETFNLNTGETKGYAEWYGSERGAIWLPSQQAVAFVDFILPESVRVLRLSRGENLPLEELAKNLGTSVLSLRSDGQEIIYSSAIQGVQSLDLEKSYTLQPLVNELPGQYNSEWYYMDSWTPDGMRAAMYKREGFYLVDPGTKAICEINLGDFNNQKLWAYDVKWSSDGRYMAILITVGEPPLRWMKLRIIDTTNGNVRDIDTDWRNVLSMDWMPGKNILLIAVNANQDPLKGGFDSLYLVNANDGISKHILPEYEFFSPSYYGVLWSPDGNSIGVSCVEVEPPDEVIERHFCTISIEIKQ